MLQVVPEMLVEVQVILKEEDEVGTVDSCPLQQTKCRTFLAFLPSLAGRLIYLYLRFGMPVSGQQVCHCLSTECLPIRTGKHIGDRFRCTSKASGYCLVTYRRHFMLNPDPALSPNRLSGGLKILYCPN